MQSKTPDDPAGSELVTLSDMPVITRITDPRDARLDDFRDLNHSDNRPDLPGGKGLVIAEGALVIPRLLSSRFPVRAIVGFEPKLSSFLEGFLRDAEEGRIPQEAVAALLHTPIYEVPREVLADVAGFDMHRGLVASADRQPDVALETILESAQSLCILEGVGDHENIGSIFRNAAGLGIDAVLFGAATADPLYRRVVRVSMGHVLRIPFTHLDGTTTTWQRSLTVLQERGFRVVALTPAPDAVPLFKAIDPAKKTAIMVGAEGPGLTRHAMKAADIRAQIPMAPDTDSLNVATAAAIGFYEVARLRHS